MKDDPVRKIIEEYKKWQQTPMSDEGLEYMEELFLSSRLQTIQRLCEASKNYLTTPLGDRSKEMHEFFTHCSSFLFDVLPIQIESDEEAIEIFSYIYGLIATVWKDGEGSAKGRNG